MIALLACVAALLYFPALRHGLGQLAYGIAVLVCLTLLAGEVGAFAALGLTLASLYRR